MTEIKKCPHCGGEPEIYADTIFFINCNNCDIGTRIKATEPEAIAAWNKRAKEENTLTLDEIRGKLTQLKEQSIELNKLYREKMTSGLTNSQTYAYDSHFWDLTSKIECLMQEFEKVRG